MHTFDARLARVLTACAAALCLAGPATAGPIVLDGTDANDHGSVSGGANLGGWEYMQRVLENLRAQVDPSVAKVVTVLGTSAGSGQAYNAIQSAFALSNLVANGWSVNYVNGPAAITAALDTLSTTTTGILYMTTANNSQGDLDSAEVAAINAKAANIATFVGGAGNAALGGGLWTMGQSGVGAYGWLSTLIPGLTYTDIGGGGIGTDISLTAAGSAAFPGLTNADLINADPWHGSFAGNLGGLQVLGTAPYQSASRNVIIGGGTRTVIAPEPTSFALLGIGLLSAGLARRRRR